MKTFQSSAIVIFSALLTFAALPETQADAAPQIFRPRGRLIQRIRDDLNDGKPLIPPLFGDSQPAVPKPSAQRPKPVSSLSGKNTPTPATGSGAKNKPTAAGSSSRKPTLATGSNSRNQPTPATGSNSRNQPTPASGSGAKSQPADDLPKEPAFVNAKGFGMVVRKAGEAFVISDVARGGNAAGEGVQRGDQIVGIGGAPILSLSEFEAIADAMRGGDRVEFEMERRGKKSKMLLQFGKADPVPADTEIVPSSSREITTPSSTSRRGLPNKYAPQKQGSGLRSILGEGATKPQTRVESLDNFDFPALNGPG